MRRASPHLKQTGELGGRRNSGSIPTLTAMRRASSRLKLTSELRDLRCPMLWLPLPCDGGCDSGEDGCQRRDRSSIDQCAYHCLEPCWMGIWLGVNNPV